MNLTPVKRNNSSNALKAWIKEKTSNISTWRICSTFEYIFEFIYELLKLTIIVCLAILIIRAPKIILFALCPALFFIFPFILIRILSKLLSFVLRFFV